MVECEEQVYSSWVRAVTSFGIIQDDQRHMMIQRRILSSIQKERAEMFTLTHPTGKHTHTKKRSVDDALSDLPDTSCARGSCVEEETKIGAFSSPLPSEATKASTPDSMNGAKKRRRVVENEESL